MFLPLNSDTETELFTRIPFLHSRLKEDFSIVCPFVYREEVTLKKQCTRVESPRGTGPSPHPAEPALPWLCAMRSFNHQISFPLNPCVWSELLYSIRSCSLLQKQTHKCNQTEEPMWIVSTYWVRFIFNNIVKLVG